MFILPDPHTLMQTQPMPDVPEDIWGAFEEAYYSHYQNGFDVPSWNEG